VSDAGRESAVELRYSEIQYLHEKLAGLNHNQSDLVPNFPSNGFMVIESSDAMNQAQRRMESYLQSLVSCKSCVPHDVLWITLGLEAVSGVIPRFLLSRDNILALNELSTRSDEVHRLVVPGLVPQILRFLSDQSNYRVASVATDLLIRVFSLSGCDRLTGDPAIINAMFDLMDTPISGLISETLPVLVGLRPTILFSFLQLTGGVGKLIRLAESCPRRSPILSGISESILAGISGSTDICLCLSDKSSLGMALMNVLVSRGQGTAVEVVSVGSLCWLLKRNHLDDFFRSKITKIIFSILEQHRVYRRLPWDLIDKLLDGPTDEEPLILLVCYLVISRAVSGAQETDFESIFNRLFSILKSGNMPEKSAAIITETLIMISSSESVPLIPLINPSYFSEQLHTTNNFLIEINFKISSMDLGIAMSDLHMIAKSGLRELVPVTSGSIDALLRTREEIDMAHKKILESVLTSMNEVRNMQSQLDGNNSTELTIIPLLNKINTSIYSIHSFDIPNTVSSLDELYERIEECNNLRTQLRLQLHQSRSILSSCLNALGDSTDEGFLTPDTPDDD
jgi:hypothetical protein